MLLNSTISPTLDQFIEYHKGAYTPERIIEIVSRALDTTPEEMKSSSHKHEKKDNRSIVCFLIKRLTMESAEASGRRLGFSVWTMRDDQRHINKRLAVKDPIFMEKLNTAFEHLKNQLLYERN